jgi:hypothetical protein
MRATPLRFIYGDEDQPMPQLCEGVFAVSRPTATKDFRVPQSGHILNHEDSEILPVVSRLTHVSLLAVPCSRLVKSETFLRKARLLLSLAATRRLAWLTAAPLTPESALNTSKQGKHKLLCMDTMRSCNVLGSAS